MIFIDGSVVAVALPAIREDLGASITGEQWAGASALAAAAGPVLGGVIVDHARWSFPPQHSRRDRRAHARGGAAVTPEAPPG